MTWNGSSLDIVQSFGELEHIEIMDSRVSSLARSGGPEVWAGFILQNI